MRRSFHFSARSLMVGCGVVAVLFFFSHIPGASADFADRHLRLYLSLGWQPMTSVPIEDEMTKANFNQVSGSGNVPVGDATLLYSFDPKLSIGVEGWFTGISTFEGYKTLPLTFYAYYEGTMDTATYTMEVRGEEDFNVAVIGPAVQWTLTSRESRQLYVRGMVGISSYSARVDRYARWSSSGTTGFSV